MAMTGQNPWAGMYGPQAGAAFQQLSPNQQLALTQGSMSRAYYGPNSPTAALQQQMAAMQGLPQSNQMEAYRQDLSPIMQSMAQSPSAFAGGMLQGPTGMGGRPMFDALQGGGIPQAQPFGGAFADVFRQAQAFRPPTPQVGSWSSQGPAMPAQPFSPVRNEGYQQQAPAAPMGQFTAQNQTRGMSGGMTMGRPTMPFANARTERRW